MKLPKDFTFKTRGDLSFCRMKRIDGDYYCSDVSEVPTKDNARWYPSEIQRNLDDKVWTLFENLDSPTFPDSLSFYHDTTMQQYNLVKMSHHPLWACYQDGDDERRPSGATYTAEEIARHFASGAWREVSFAEAAPKEREMVFPFTCKWGDNCKDIYTFAREEDGIICVWEGGFTEYPEDMLRAAIKNGTCIVTSVGAQMPVEAAPEASSPVGAPASGIEVSKSTVGSVSSLSIKIDSEAVIAAPERMEKLAIATERVNAALEEFGSLMSDLQSLFAHQQVIGCQTFCCEEG